IGRFYALCVLELRDRTARLPSMQDGVRVAPQFHARPKRFIRPSEGTARSRLACPFKGGGSFSVFPFSGAEIRLSLSGSEPASLVRARAIHDAIFPPTVPVSEQLSSGAAKTLARPVPHERGRLWPSEARRIPNRP